MAEDEWGLAIMTTSLSLCSRDEGFARGLTGRAEFVRLVNDCTLPNHAFCLSGVCVKLRGFDDLDRSGHLDDVKAVHRPSWKEYQGKRNLVVIYTLL